MGQPDERCLPGLNVERLRSLAGAFPRPPAGRDYRHHQTGEDNADAHLKRMLLGHQVLVPVTAGRLDLGPWERVHYGEFDGQRSKRLVLKAFGISDSSTTRPSDER